MRATVIATANMCMARFNVSRDELFSHLAGTLVILANITYEELDQYVWSRQVYDEMTKGGITMRVDLQAVVIWLLIVLGFIVVHWLASHHA